MHKNLYDVRGKTTNISRLASFDQWAFLHMVFYRIAIFASIAYGILVLLWYAVPGLDFEVKVATALIWILFTPQVFAARKAIVMTLSKGMAFGHLNTEFEKTYKAKYHPLGGALIVLPYIATAIWILGFFAMLVWWSL
jgi:hypothetical protein